MSVYEALDFVLSGLRIQDSGHFFFVACEAGSSRVAGHVWHVCGVAVARVLP